MMRRFLPDDELCLWRTLWHTVTDFSAWGAFIRLKIRGETFTAARTLPKTLSHHCHWRFQSPAFEPSHSWFFFYYFILSVCALVNFFMGSDHYDGTRCSWVWMCPRFYWFRDLGKSVKISYTCVATIVEFADTFSESISCVLETFQPSERFYFSIQIIRTTFQSHLSSHCVQMLRKQNSEICRWEKARLVWLACCSSSGHWVALPQ